MNICHLLSNRFKAIDADKIAECYRVVWQATDEQVKPAQILSLGSNWIFHSQNHIHQSGMVIPAGRNKLKLTKQHNHHF